MKIKRVDEYQDQRFPPETLKEHGCFVIDDRHTCAFKIINENSARVIANGDFNLAPVIDDFRFYTEHITNFYDEDSKLIKSFEPLKTFKLDIKAIQPSQFLVSEEKLQAIKTFVFESKDLYIPVALIDGQYISCDGHTRLSYAADLGIERVNAFLSDPGDYLKEFAEEAKKRGVHTPSDLKKVSKAAYETGWHQFCDDFFKVRE